MINHIKKQQIALLNFKQCKMEIQYVENCAETDPNRYHNHIHEVCELYLNISGNVSFVCEDRIYPVKKGNVILTREYEAHHCVYHDSSCHRHYLILFSGEKNEELLPMFYDRLPGTGNLVILSEKEELNLIALCEKMFADQDNTVSSLIHFLKIINLLGTGKIRTDTEAVSCKETVRALQYINQNISEKISISDLATLTHASVSTFERNFKKDVGMVPTRYIAEKRLSLALTMLSSSMSILEISEKCGFPDYAHFIADFKKRFGLTPGQYRKKQFKG